MGRIDINLPDDIEQKLRMEVGRRSGFKRGALTDAIVEAINSWLKDDDRNSSREKKK